MPHEQIRLIDENGKQLGLFSYEEALNLAKSKNLDLFLITKKVDPPVYRLGNADKLRYEQEKKLKKRKAQVKQSLPKTIRIGYNEAQHDLITKAKKAEKFLEQGKILTIQLRLRGREKRHFSLAKEKIEYFISLIQVPHKVVQPLKKSPFGFIISLKKQ